MNARFVLPLAIGLSLCAVSLSAQDSGRAAPPDPAPAPQGRGGKSGDARHGSDEDLTVIYFKICDYDGDGWVTFGESLKSMHLDRSAFRVYDTDVDGRISQDEFARRYRAIVSRGGAFAPPIAKPDPRRIARRSPDDLLEAFDRNKDLALDDTEVERALEEYGGRGVDPKVILEKLDKDRSKKLEKAEMQDLLDVLVPPAETREKRKFGSIEELFGRTEAREKQKDSTHEPAHIVGPVRSFQRLDIDGSGGISLQDLIELQRPIQIPVRASAVIATLDADGDGVISDAEFRAALR